MWLTDLHIQNFRGLEDIEMTLAERANVIVGPNAIGKTTILEAIRLAKAVLAPRTLDEAQHAFTSLGAIAPHTPQQMNFAAIARDPTKPLKISCSYKLAETDTSQLSDLVPQIARSLVQARLGTIPANQAQLALVQFLSTPQGQEAFKEAQKHVRDELVPKFCETGVCKLELNIDPGNGTIFGTHQFSQLVFSALESKLSPHQALFSYFPADRALPTGEVPIQIGSQDIAAQIQSHNAQPQTKYHRLKHTIINSVLMKNLYDSAIEDDFKTIFSGVLRNRHLVGIEANQFGLISIRIKDLEAGRDFDIDAMSSGEKGLILTFLIIARSIKRGGIILVDEPELHLNPAVCRLLLPFLIDTYLTPRKIQAIICSHSPEILEVAFERQDCDLHHLQASNVISNIYPDDKREFFDALSRLGTSTSDVLFSKGSVFVEGEHDSEILEAGFADKIAKYKLTALGGRPNVEREIRSLQDSEAKGRVNNLTCFIFDLDNRPTGLTSTSLVRVLQWKRRCIENYLIDEKIIYDLLRKPEHAASHIDKRGAVKSIFREIAMSQLPDFVAHVVYNRLNYENPGLRPKEISGKSFPDIGHVLYARIALMKSQMARIDETGWKQAFTQSCEDELRSMRQTWDSDWLTLCDGKRFFLDLCNKYRVKGGPLRFKKVVMETMRATRSKGWMAIQQMIDEALRV